MDCSRVQLDNLSDELLLCILNQLNNTDALYSLVGVNQRLDRVVRDIIYTKHIDLTNEASASVLDRFCLDILPRIHSNVESIVLVASTSKRLLRAGSYPKLRKLTLLELDESMASRLFANKSPFARMFKEQISQLVVKSTDTTYTNELLPWMNVSRKIFVRIAEMFSNLTHLDFGSCYSYLPTLVSINNLRMKIGFSSTLVDLSVGLAFFDDCLFLLEGKLKHLQRLIVDFEAMRNKPPIFDNTKPLPKLKCFSLTAGRPIIHYDDRIIPLLRRMSNLEELALHLEIEHRSAFIDGTHLEKEILVHLPRLRSFNFNFLSRLVPTNGVPTMSSDDIRRTFVGGRGYLHVDCFVDKDLRDTCRCQVYSLPYTFDRLEVITQNFPGGKFNFVRILSMDDVTLPFERDFFVEIARDFSVLTTLCIYNLLQPEQKRSRLSVNDEEAISIIVFPHLTHLDIQRAHFDYIKQFLFDTNTCLPSLNTLQIKYKHLVVVTKRFKNKAARANCAKVNHLYFEIGCTVVPSKYCYLYFPSWKQEMKNKLVTM